MADGVGSLQTRGLVDFSENQQTIDVGYFSPI